MGKKEIWALSIGLVLVIGFAVWGALDSKKADESMSESMQADVVYYYGEECPHCKDVAKYLDENAVSEKVEYVKKEVWYNRKNNTEMMDRVRECGIDPDEAGVPFLYARGQCLIGAPAVIDFFEGEMNGDESGMKEDVELDIEIEEDASKGE